MILPTGPIRNPSKSSHGFTLSYYIWLSVFSDIVLVRKLISVLHFYLGTNTKKNHKSKKICANAEAGIDKDVIRDVAGSRACRGMQLQRWKKRKAR